jgi:TPM domain
MKFAQRTLALVPLRTLALVAALVLIVSIAAGALFFLNPKPSAALTVSPLLVNQTADHRYDRSLRESIRFFEGRTDIQLGIILKSELPAQKSIEEFAAVSFKQIKLGEKFWGKALLFVWAEKERLFKIEVSYDLEGIFTDALCRRLELGARTFLLSNTPYARRDFLTELIVTMGLHYLDYKKTGRLSDLSLTSTGPGALSFYLSGGAGIVGRGYAATVEQVKRELAPLPPALVSEMQPDASAEIVLQRYLKSLDMGIGDPQLPLVTEGSVYFRMEKPHAPGYLQRIRRYLEDAMPYRIIEKGDLAAVLFKPNHPVLPILLRRNEKGLWFIDEPQSWATFHLFQDGGSRLKYRDSPFAFAAINGTVADERGSMYADRASAAALVAYPFDLKDRIRRAENEIADNPSQAAAYLNLAEILHFEMFWIQAAIPLYEKALELDPARKDLRWRLIDIFSASSDMDAMEAQALALLKLDPNDYYARYYYDWLRKN